MANPTIKMDKARYNSWKKTWDVRVTVEQSDGWISVAYNAEEKTKEDAEVDAMLAAGRFAEQYNTHVELVG